MAFRSEYAEWRDELAGKRRSHFLGHVIAAAVGLALAVLAVALEHAARL